MFSNIVIWQTSGANRLKTIEQCGNSSTVSAFMNKILLNAVGNTSLKAFKSCIELDAASYKLKFIRKWTKFKSFEGRVVVSGGKSNNEDVLNTNEVLDHVASMWSKMTVARVHHSLVAVRNRLFVFGRSTSAVFDSLSNTFSELNNHYQK